MPICATATCFTSLVARHRRWQPGRSRRRRSSTWSSWAAPTRGGGSDCPRARRHVMVRVGGDGVTIADAGSRNGSFIADQPVTTERRLAPGDVVEAGRTLLAFQEHHEDADARADGRLIAFNRPPRVA